MSTNIKIALQAATLISILTLGACGGSDSGSTPPPPPPPPPSVTAPSGLSYPAPGSYQIGQAITPLTPSVSGTVTSYAVSPALPAGLTLNTTSGVISGTPTAAAASASYTVTATNSGGSTNTTVVFVVTDAPAAVVYDNGGGNYTYTVGDPIAALIPTVSGDAVATWAISPALPAGLAFNTANGTVTGTPTAASSTTIYTVTAKTAGGASTSTILVIQVQKGLILELGNTTIVSDLRFNGTRLLSRDLNGDWVLWDYAAAKILAHDRSQCVYPTCAEGFQPLDLAGTTFAIGTSTGIDLYSATDGSVLARITANLSWWKLAADGSYLAGGNNSGLYVWDTTGKQITVKSGDYHQATVIGLPNEVRVGGGAAGANVVESVALPSGTSTLSPQFQGIFKSWFADGSHFLTSIGTTWWAYTSAGVQTDVIMVTSDTQIHGQGSYFWTVGTGNAALLNVYAVGASASPAYSTNNTTILGLQGTQLFVLPQDSTSLAMQVIDFSGNAPVATGYTLAARPRSVAGNTGGQWALGGDHGLILDGTTIAGTPRYLGPGEARTVAGSSNRFAVATAAGKIMVYNTSDNSSGGSINLLASKLAMSADGSVMVAQSTTDGTLSVYAMPAGTLTHTWPAVKDFTLSASGTVLATIDNTNGGMVAPTNGGAAIWSGPTPGGASFQPELWLSPDGTQLAVPSDPNSNAFTSIYNNGVFTTTIQGWGAGWLDNGRLLVNHYIAGNGGAGGGSFPFSGATIVSQTGTQLGTSPVTELRLFTPASADTVYAPAVNKILSLTDGTTVWSSPNPFSITYYYVYPDALAGPEVVFVSGTLVRAEAR